MNHSSQRNEALAHAPVGKLMLRLALPAVLSQLVNALYNIVDRIYIGNIPEEGALALTGIGLCFPVLMLISAFASLFGMGGAPQAAIKMGEGDHDAAEKILGNCAATLACTSVILMVIFFVFGRDLLFLFGASENTIAYAWSYLSIYLIGTISVQVTLGLNPFITTQGFATYSMTTIMIGAMLNIILDPIFIFVFDMGVSGAATATILSQTVSALWVLRFLTGKKTTLKIKRCNLRIQSHIILPVVALGLSPFMMSATESILNISFNSSLQRYGGDVAVGAMTIIGSVFLVAMMPLQGIMQGAQPIISYNYGAGNMKRVLSAFKVALAASLTLSVSIFAVMQLFPEPLIRLFNDDAELVALAASSLRVYAAGIFIMGAQYACQNTFVALGQAKISLFLACLRKLILLIPMIFILPLFFENKVFAVFLAEPVADITAGICTITAFAIMIPKILKKTKAE